ncbi:MAG: hypothetical protein ACAI43_10805 [Phycisphaerae bacterium]|nr:hypothetical protein [Tepidisphaeraceae bacterium]
MHATPALALLVVAAAGLAPGCAPPEAPPTAAELREHARVDANADHARRLVADGRVYAGQDVREALRLCVPYRVDVAGRYTFAEFFPVPNTVGFSWIAVDGKLVSARHWTCVTSVAAFDTLGPAERAAAGEAYEAVIAAAPNR